MNETILQADGLYHVYESKAEDGNVVALRGLHIDMKAGKPSPWSDPRLRKIHPHEVPWRADEAQRRVRQFEWKEHDSAHGAKNWLNSVKRRSRSSSRRAICSRTSTRDNVAQPLRHQGVSSKKALALADAMLTRLGMGHRSNALPAMLSGGEQQRGHRSCAHHQPRLILADEPTGALDPVSSREVLALFKDLHQNDGVFLIVYPLKGGGCVCQSFA